MSGFFQKFLLLLLPIVAANLPAWGASEKALPQLFLTSDRCLACHNGLITDSGADVSIGSQWRSSIMAHASRDPYWQASVRREALMHPKAEKEIQDECAACHMPMARYQAKVRGGKGRVFAHFPVLPARTVQGRLAADAVSCTLCHQIQAEKLGTEESFTAGFRVDTASPLGERPVYGPYEVDSGRRQVMRSAARMVPNQSKHLQKSELCGSCHTLYTHTRGPDGRIIGTLPEQMPYLEWRHSSYAPQQQHCQSCHLPQLQKPMRITSVLGRPRENFSRHVFRGGNFFMLNLLNRYRTDLNVTALPQDLAETMRNTTAFLQSRSGSVSIHAPRIENGRLQAAVEIVNFAGHKLPTAYPSRRVWLHFSVQDADGTVFFESGALRADGSIVGNDNDVDKTRYEKHYTRIDDESQVQIYEAIMATPAGRVTTGLLQAIRFVKDNRILPYGFTKEDAGEDIAVQGGARSDADFVGGTDRVMFSVPVAGGRGPFQIDVRVLYQPIAFRWAQNLLQQQAEEIERFVSYYNRMADEAAIALATDSKTVPAP